MKHEMGHLVGLVKHSPPRQSACTNSVCLFIVMISWLSKTVSNSETACQNLEPTNRLSDPLDLIVIKQEDLG